MKNRFLYYLCLLIVITLFGSFQTNQTKEQTVAFIDQQINDYRPNILSSVIRQEIKLEYEWLVIKTYTKQNSYNSQDYHITKYDLATLKTNFEYRPSGSLPSGKIYNEYYAIDFTVKEPIEKPGIFLSDKVAAEKTLKALSYLKNFVTKSPF